MKNKRWKRKEYVKPSERSKQEEKTSAGKVQEPFPKASKKPEWAGPYREREAWEDTR